MLYFAYGSNMLKIRLENQGSRVPPRIGPVVDRGISMLPGYKIVFNKLSNDRSGKTNMVQDKEAHVLGVTFELTNEQIRNLDRIEGEGYRRESIVVDCNGEKAEVATYFATENYVQENLLPTKQYLGYLIDGAKEHGFPEDYIIFLENTPHL